MTRAAALLALLLLLASASRADEAAALLRRHCIRCHAGASASAGLRLDRPPSPEAAKKAAAAVRYEGAVKMPPTGKLAAREIAALAQWAGAARARVHWAFQPIRLVLPPPVEGAPTGIDAFVREKLLARGLDFSSPADRGTLLRRLTFDLTGLPPTPGEVNAFLADPRPDAYERVVERLLASPAYGERWGRHWLDLVRYADSGGFEGDKDRPLMWRYRDWVIDAFNADLPYDRFLQLQLAGDEIAPGDPGALIATGYLACGPQDIVENNARTRANEIDDLVSTTGSVALGLTVGCARCHDHKYDPIPQVDYYRLAALFAPTERREVEIPTPDERRAADARNAELEPLLAPLRRQAEELKARGDAAGLKSVEEKIAAIEARRLPLPKAQVVTDKGRDFPPTPLLIRGDAYHPGPEVMPGFLTALPGGAAAIGPAPPGAPTTGRRRALAAWLTSPRNPLTARVWVNRIWRHHFGRGLVNSPSNFGVSGELPSHPELLDWLAQEFRRGGQRLKPLHRLMVLSRTYRQSSVRDPKGRALDPENRLYSRMPVRRLEAEAVRDSLLAVAGTLNPERGGPPVYPPVDPTLRADTFQGMNWPEGEDSPKTWRRSVYVKVKRSLLLPLLEVFDCPEITYTVAARNVTTTPLQALTLLNDPLIRRQAGLFAERLQRDRPGDTWAQIDRAYRLCFGRPPTVAERRLSLTFVRQRSLADFCHALFNLNEMVYVP